MRINFLIFLLLPLSVSSQNQYLEAFAHLNQIVPDLFNNPTVLRGTRYKDQQASNRVNGHPEVNTTSGLLIGSTLPEAHAFYSIPYGEAPVGDLRFRPPVAAAHRGMLNVSEQNFIECFQFPLNCTNDDNCDKNLSEDCLVLNVNVPSSVDLTTIPSDRVPVMVWIHGGAFFTGSGTSKLYDGRWLSNTTNTIVVTMNYRLGSLGFLVYEENGETLPGNQGLKDQQLALRWVQDNIEKFGGNKSMVTIFGQSAGAQSIMHHLMSDVSDPLFHRAIMQSIPASYYTPTLNEAKLKTNALMALTGCVGRGIECLRNISATAIFNAHFRVIFAPVFNYFNLNEPFRPVLDEVEFTRQPLDCFRDGNWQRHKDVVIGTTEDEITWISVALSNTTLTKSSYEAATNFFVGTQFGPDVADRYSLLAGGDPDDNFDYTDILARQLRDMVFSCPVRALARFMSNTSSSSPPRVYLYLDEHDLNGTSCEEITFSCGYSFHGSDVHFLFNNGENSGFIFSEDDKIVSKMFSDFWGNFAYYGMPSSDIDKWPNYVSTPLLGGAIDPWSFVKLQAPESTIENQFHNDLCDFWDSIGYYNISATADVTTPDAITSNPIGAEETTQAATSLMPSSIVMIFCLISLSILHFCLR